MAQLLIEIGVEELPALPLLKALRGIEESWKRLLEEYRLASSFRFEYTPRRLVILSNDFPAKQPDTQKELFGPPVEIAFKVGEPTQAALSFAKKSGVSLEQMQRVQKGDKEVLYVKQHLKGKPSEVLLNEMINKWVASMPFGKSMRWGSLIEEFIRPIRWLQVRLDNEVVSAELFGVESSDYTYGHRMDSMEPVTLHDTKAYESLLQDHGVTLRAKERKARIKEAFRQIEESQAVFIEEDEALLNEVVAITENPTPLVGKFDKKFMKLPPEVIITSMKEHQRYFPVYKEGKLQPLFVVVSNALTDDFSKVIAGNERVLRPRLEDALFFYENDLKRGLHTEGLEKVQFIDGLGSLKEKIERERAIATRLATLYKQKLEAATGKGFDEVLALLQRAVELAKADLLSEMVYEFTELQGLMGYYYAKTLGEDSLVYNAIKEQYLPTGERSPLPSHLFSAIVSLSQKLDTLLGLFSAGKIPTGSKDPFALRRAAIGIIRMVKAFELPFDIEALTADFAALYPNSPDVQQIKSFFFDRLLKLFDVNPSIIAAVLATGGSDLLEIAKRIDALSEIVGNESFDQIFSTFKRVANISKEIDLDALAPVDPTLFEKKEEQALYDAFNIVANKAYGSYKERLEALFGLKPVLDAFFDHVLVNTEDEKLRANRQALIGHIYKAFREVADIKEISL